MDQVFGVVLVVIMVGVVVFNELRDKKRVAELKAVKDEATAKLAAAQKDFEEKLKVYLGNK